MNRIEMEKREKLRIISFLIRKLGSSSGQRDSFGKIKDLKGSRRWKNHRRMSN